LAVQHERALVVLVAISAYAVRYEETCRQHQPRILFRHVLPSRLEQRLRAPQPVATPILRCTPVANVHHDDIGGSAVIGEPHDIQDKTCSMPAWSVRLGGYEQKKTAKNIRGDFANHARVKKKEGRK
jgi:hypothetical protein